MGHATTHTPGSSSTSSTTSSIKPTGWIRADSAPRPVLGDRTNLASGSKSTPLRSSSKYSMQSARRSTPATSGKDTKQQKLSSFFASNTAPPAAPKRVEEPIERASPFQDSPSLARTRSRSRDVHANARSAAALQDDELEARAALLIRRRFGNVTRSLNSSRSSTPTRAPCQPGHSQDPESPRAERPAALNRSMLLPPPQPPPLRQESPTKSRGGLHQNPVAPSPSEPQAGPSQNHITSTRPTRLDLPDMPSSSPPFEPTLMQQSLSDFTPLPWERAHSSRMMLFQRLAGRSKDEILITEKSRMADEVAKAHARMHPRSPTVPRKRMAIERQPVSSSNKKRTLKQPVALDASLPNTPGFIRPEAVLESPRSNRKIYALETQLNGAPLAGRAASVQLQLLSTGSAGGRSPIAAEPRRAVSETRYDATMSSASRQNQFSSREGEVEAVVEEESETLPLPWSVEDDTKHVEAEEAGDEDDETQPLPWEYDEDEQPDLCVPHHFQQQQPESPAEVPPSDDEDLLLQPFATSSSSLTSPSRVDANLPSSKEQRVKHEKQVPTSASSALLRHSCGSMMEASQQQRSLPKVSPITLTQASGGMDDRFDRVVAALKHEERRQNKGMQLSLNSFLTPSSNARRKMDSQDERSRYGLSEDLQDVLSDDDDDAGEGDTTLLNELDQSATEVEVVDGETDATQPLGWPCSPARSDRPTIAPLQASWMHATQRSVGSSPRTGSSQTSGVVSLPSESNLHDAGNTQLRSFFHDL